MDYGILREVRKPLFWVLKSRIFINAAKSGFNNLLGIKSEYFGEVKKRFEAKIQGLFDETTKQNASSYKNELSAIMQSANIDKNIPLNSMQSTDKDTFSSLAKNINAEKNELYNKLYTFFDSKRHRHALFHRHAYV